MSSPVSEARYPAALLALARSPLPHFLCAPSISADGTGVACGDRVEVDVRPVAGTLALAVRVEGCLMCRASAARMVAMVEGGRLDEVASLIERVLGAAVVGTDPLELVGGRALRPQESSCVVVPWQTLRHVLARLGIAPGRYTPLGGLDLGLSCDACVRVEQLQQPRPDQQTPARGRFGPLLEAIRRSKSARRPDCPVSLARFGKLVLTSSEHGELDALVERANPHQIRYWSRIHLLGVIAGHLAADSAPEDLRQAIGEARLRGFLMVREGRRIGEAARAHGIEVTAVKGMATRAWYPDPDVRFFKDLDFITPTMGESMRLAALLVGQFDYRFPMSNGVPFSVKVVTHEGRERLTGHFHLERSEQGRTYVVDISFPNLPLGLTEVLAYPDASPVGPSRPELVTITLTHLLKHHVAPIKDINDLYLAIRFMPADEAVACVDMLRRHSLVFRACLLVGFLQKGYMLPTETPFFRRIAREASLAQKLAARAILRAGWPFEYEPHLGAQIVDAFSRARRAGGVRHGLRTVESLLLKRYDRTPGPASPLADRLGVALYQRLYLVPVILFARALNPVAPDVARRLDEAGFAADPIGDCAGLLLRREHATFLVTAVGIFRPSGDAASEADERVLMQEVTDVLRCYEVTSADLIPVRMA